MSQPTCNRDHKNLQKNFSVLNSSEPKQNTVLPTSALPRISSSCKSNSQYTPYYEKAALKCTTPYGKYFKGILVNILKECSLLKKNFLLWCFENKTIVSQNMYFQFTINLLLHCYFISINTKPCNISSKLLSHKSFNLIYNN